MSKAHVVSTLRDTIESTEVYTNSHMQHKHKAQIWNCLFILQLSWCVRQGDIIAHTTATCFISYVCCTYHYT